jgi:gamma-glutamylcyclotransferase (GGCT)/AIG2-like uncharacterized protein YtfP
MMVFYKTIFVYGTLKKGCYAANLLSESTFIGTAFTPPYFELYACNTYPALCRSPNGYMIEGEIYGIDEKTFEILNQYEGVDSGLYSCEKIEIDQFFPAHSQFLENDVFAYIYQGDLKNFRKVAGWSCI